MGIHGIFQREIYLYLTSPQPVIVVTELSQFRNSDTTIETHPRCPFNNVAILGNKAHT